MDLCYKLVLDRKIWVTRDDLSMQRNREGIVIGKETVWE